MGDGLVGAIAGIASGATKLIVGHPFETIKIRVQTEGSYGRFKGPLHCLFQTIKLVRNVSNRKASEHYIRELPLLSLDGR